MSPVRCGVMAAAASALLLSACATTGNPELKLLRLARSAEASYQSGKLDKAKKQYEQLLEANPKYATAYLRLGAIAYREGDANTARTQFEVAATKDPSSAQARYNLAMLSLNEASRYLNEYIALAPHAESRERIRVLLAQLNEFAVK